MKITIVKKATVKKKGADLPSCPFIVEDMIPPGR